MRLGLALRRFVVPVQSQAVERRASAAPTAAPGAGARWGRPADFDQASRSRPPAAPTGFNAEWIDTVLVLKGTETHRQIARVAAAELAEPEAIRSATFDCGTRSVRGTRVHDYVRFDFPLFEPVGARGEPHPPPTPTPDEAAT